MFVKAPTISAKDCREVKTEEMYDWWTERARVTAIMSDVPAEPSG